MSAYPLSRHPFLKAPLPTGSMRSAWASAHLAQASISAP